MKIKIFKFNIIFLVSSLLLVFGCAKEDDSKTSTDNEQHRQTSDNATSERVTNVVTGIRFIQFTAIHAKLMLRLIMESMVSK